MSDFLTNLLDRHMGIGEKVLPRIRGRFEPDANVAQTFLPQYAQKKSHHPMSGVTSPANDPAGDNMDNPNSAKQPVIEQPGTMIRSAESVGQKTRKETQYNYSPESTRQPISEVPGDIDKKKVIKGKRVTPDSQLQGFVQQHNNVPGKKTVNGEDNMKNSLDDKVKNVFRPPFSASKQGHLVKPTKPDDPIHTVPVNTQENFYNQQSVQRPPGSSKMSPDLPDNLPNPEPGLIESSSTEIALQNTDTVSHGLFGTPPRLSHQQSEMYKRFLINDAKAETKPVINVTIGRIEIQATQFQEQKQSKQQRKSSNVMSLDKYLRQRSHGGNR